MNSKTVKVIRFSEWEEHREGCNPARVVMWERSDKDSMNSPIEQMRKFVTHIEFDIRDGGVPTGELSFSHGHYDLTREEAGRDFLARCTQYNLAEAKTIVRSPEGSARRVVRVGDIRIPDLWHIAMWVGDVEKDRTVKKIINHHHASRELLEAQSEAIIECWHIAHDLKRHIQESGVPEVPPAIENEEKRVRELAGNQARIALLKLVQLGCVYEDKWREIKLALDIAESYHPESQLQSF